MSIPEGMFIDNSGDIDYAQLYAQVMYELREQHSPYWFNNDEVARIQQLNQEYMEQKDIAVIVNSCFRKPAEGETGMRMSSSDILGVIRKEFPSVPNTMSSKVTIGLTLKEQGYEYTECSHVKFYRVIALKSA